MVDMDTTMKIPTVTIEWIVNRYHVGTPDAEIEQNIRSRAKAAGTLAEKRIQAMVDYAIEHHRKNQSLYHSVVTGRF
jgi:hypothetical protein